MKKGDKILYAILIVVVAILGGVFLYISSTKTDLIVEVHQNNELVYSESLSNNNTFLLGTDQFNEVTIENGKVFMSKANCKDELCIKTPAISMRSQNIVCLPHKVIVKLVENME